jgi:tetratricopeptide (TPR) repeat protein
MKSIIKLLCLSLPVSMLLQIAQVQAKVNSQPDDAPSTGSVTQKNKQNLSDEEKSFKSALAYIDQANQALNMPEKEKLLRDAQVELTNALSKNKGYVEAIYFRGVVSLMLGKLDDGEKDLLQVIEINPKTAEAHYNLACLYSVRNNTELALTALDNALKNGFKDTDYLMHDPDLAFLRNFKEFGEVLTKNKIF